VFRPVIILRSNGTTSQSHRSQYTIHWDDSCIPMSKCMQIE
jgi:hypothetical protein